MAGSEKSGVVAADRNLFENSICIITKTKKTDSDAFDAVKSFWEEIGTQCKTLSPHDHDSFISYISHLPHVAATALTVAANPNSLEFASQRASHASVFKGFLPVLDSIIPSRASDTSTLDKVPPWL